MNSKRTFSVAVIGIPENERHVLKNIFKLSLYRTRSYTLVNTDIEVPPEILIVDADRDEARARWESLCRRYGRKAAPPTVMVSNEPPCASQGYTIRRPFVATRVLSVLDQVAMKELSFIPELVIGEEASIPNPAAESLKEAVAPDSGRQRYSALVVDDSLPVRKQIELELKLFGIHVDCAETGERAFELLDDRAYDIIFLDVVLPGVDGYKICKTIKRDKLRKETPVVMLTGKTSPFDRVRGTFAGCDTYLTKPVGHNSFRKVVKKYLHTG